MMSLYGVKGQGHNTLQDYYEEDPLLYKKSYKFTVIRAPVDRFVSAFLYLKKGGMGSYDKEFFNRYLSDCPTVNDIVLKMRKDKELERKILSWTHFKPQYQYLTRDGQIDMDFIISYDDLEDGFCRLRSILGKNDTVLKKLNVTGNENKSIDINISNSDYLKGLYNEDVELFDRVGEYGK